MTFKDFVECYMLWRSHRTIDVYWDCVCLDCGLHPALVERICTELFSRYGENDYIDMNGTFREFCSKVEARQDDEEYEIPLDCDDDYVTFGVLPPEDEEELLMDED